MTSTLLTGVLTALLVWLLVAYVSARRRDGQIRAELARYAAIVAHSSDAIINESLDGRITGWNAAAERIFGYRVNEVIGQEFDGLLVPVDRMAEAKQVSAQLARGESLPPFETVHRHRDGTTRDVAIAPMALRATDGRITEIVRTIRDISELKASERAWRGINTSLGDQVTERTSALDRALHDFRNVLDVVPSMIGYWDRDLVNRFANRAYHAWFGVDHDTLPGRRLQDLLGPELFALNREHIDGALRGEPQTFERAIPQRDGHEVRYSLAHYLPDVVEGEVRGFYTLVHDVTELSESRRLLAYAMRENAALLSTIRGHAIYSVTDRRGRIIDINDNFCAISGYTRDELMGQTHRLISSRTHPRQFWMDMWQQVASGRSWHGKVCNRAKDGSLYWVDSIIAPFLGADGEIEKYISIRTDVTQAHLAELRVADSESRFRSLSEGSPMGVFAADAHGTVTYGNSRWQELLGMPANGSTGASWLERVSNEEREEVTARWLTSARDGRDLDEEFRVQLETGETRQVHVRTRIVRDAEDRNTGLVGTVTDVTARRVLERRLRDSEDLLERTGRVARVGGWRVDLAAGTVEWTAETKRIHEVPADYQPTLEEGIHFYAPESRPVIERLVREAMAGGDGYDVELELITANGRRLWVRAIGEVEWQDGTPTRLVGAFQDISEQRAVDDELRRVTAQAQAASAAKSHFLANTSHEIRTPLNAVIGLAYLLEQTALDNEQQGLLSRIQIAGRSLLGVINNVLDLSKIEAGELLIDDAPFDLRLLLDELRLVMTPQAAAKGLAVSISADDFVPPLLRADPGRIRQILTNLLENAIKFTERGHVAVTVACIERGTDRATLRFVVADSGIGILPEAQSRLFTPFMQADASTTRRFGGTGLGLSIVRHLTELMGGEVGVVSTPDIGSEFWVQLPVTVTSAGEEFDTTSELQPLELVIAEDDPDQRNHLLSLTHALGWRAEGVESGEQLVERVLQRHAAGRLPDALLVDWQLPGMDGAQALASLVTHLGSSGVPAAVLISAHDRMRVETSPFAHLADSIVVKPVIASTLFNAVNSAVARDGGGQERVVQSTHLAAAGAHWLAGVRLLVVDDSDINLDVASRILARQGADVVTATSGEDALAQLRIGTVFDAVLMDVQMPVMDGNEATRRIRTELGMRTLPIIALTAGALVAERHRVLEAGMNDFLSKPFDPEQLVRTVRRHIERVRGKVLPLVPRMPLVTPMATTAIARPAWPTIEGIDRNEVADRFDHDVPLYLSMLERVLDEYADLAAPAALQSSFSRDRVGLAARLHKLRGGAGLVGASQLSKSAGDAEAVCRHGAEDADDASAERVLTAVSDAWTALEANAHPLLRAIRFAHPVVPAAVPATTHEAVTPPLDRAAIEELQQLLARQDLAAIARFAELAEPLRAVLGDERLAECRRSVHQLDFAGALQVFVGAHALECTT